MVDGRQDAPVGQFSAAIRTRGLTKRFRGGQVAVDRVDLEVPRGSVFGFLGPNGSGKTTTIRMLLGLVTPTVGEVEILGGLIPGALGAVLPQVGALVEGPAFQNYLSGPANLARMDAADRTSDPSTARRRIADALDRVSLTSAGSKRYRAYSLGMRQRLGLAAALLRPRELLVLDEPTNGLDPQGTREVRALVRALAADGLTVFLSTHLLAEVEQVCTHVGVMRTGRLVTAGRLDVLLAATAPRVELDTTDPEAAVRVLDGLGLSSPRVRAGAGAATVSAALDGIAVAELAPALVAAGVGIHRLVVVRPDLEELYVSLTGEGFDVER
ncbi:MAG: ABC transporter ATP-binding protein [Acidimicrobiales bacterium]